MKSEKEIGSFLELSFPKGLEYYRGEHIARLNSGRAAIYHASRILQCDTVYLPRYLCESVREFLVRKGLRLEYYSIDSQFNPRIASCPENAAVVLVNYYGIMGQERMQLLASKYRKAILDNSQAFFAAPIEGCMNVYSPRKFLGVPDGAYVVGALAEKYLLEYEQDYSSDTSLFLLLRTEYGCEGKAYENRKLNEERIDTSDIRRMSKLTHTILDGTDYEAIKSKRKDNFDTACKRFASINRIDPLLYYSQDCVPMVYPLVIEAEGLLERLLEHRMFQGHWWSYLLTETDPSSMEYWLSRYLVPITIDQRYEREDINEMSNIINKELKAL